MTTLVWLQRELRLDYLPALNAALALEDDVIIAYFHDPKLTIGNANNAWLAHALEKLRQDVEAKGGCLWLINGDFQTRFSNLLKTQNITRVFYSFQVGEPFNTLQHKALDICQQLRVKLKPFFSEFWLKPTDFSNQKGQPYLVFTPFHKALINRQASFEPLDRLDSDLTKTNQTPCPTEFQSLPEDLARLKTKPWAKKVLATWEIGETPAWQIFTDFLENKLEDYIEYRDFPAIDATSHLSVYLHFGHLPARQLYFEIQSFIEEQPDKTTEAQAWLRQLAWKEFARHLLYWFPNTQTQPFQARFQNMVWEDANTQNSIDAIQAWQKGLTGIPIIDAGMRELWATGTMHNRVRMLVASFLTKNLNQHWLIGQNWFEDTLMDADPANNVMGWQWVAGCGVDAAPYYRLFNPVTQSKKFDAEGEYLRHWLPELRVLDNKSIHAPWETPIACQSAGIKLGIDYPFPLVDLTKSRQQHLQRVNDMKNQHTR